ncbi:MAG: ABC transporter permease [Leptospiraceae bacterium]|nr:ABC transporter permease [Leptospiraceae bacterium]MDW8305760.1 ABC transporter permease [Leptospiraceae bacterium]
MKIWVLKTLGIVGVLFVWWLFSLFLQSKSEYVAFHGLGPVQSLESLWTLFYKGEIWPPLKASLRRVFLGLLLAFLIGIPTGLVFGYLKSFRHMADIPFQFLRMVSPLSWMPLAILFFPGWESAIVFLVTMATLWPLLFATASGVTKINPDWILLGKNLGASELQMLRYIILPAVLPDILSGLRLAVGIAWVVIVPAEYLGVTSGLGYAINDARDTIHYSKLVAWVMVVGLVGFSLDRFVGYLLGRFSWHELEKRERIKPWEKLFLKWEKKWGKYETQGDFQI